VTNGRQAEDRDAGVATVFVAVCVVVLVLVTGIAGELGTVLLSRHRAEAAADLAALAAASVALGGKDRSCAAAADLAGANGGELVSCDQDSLTIRVQVRVRVRAGPLVGTAIGRARAGPVEPP
jgi:secretion/DNA translocation related TadE-like protein